MRKMVLYFLINKWEQLIKIACSFGKKTNVGNIWKVINLYKIFLIFFTRCLFSAQADYEMRKGSASLGEKWQLYATLNAQKELFCCYYYYWWWYLLNYLNMSLFLVSGVLHFALYDKKKTTRLPCEVKTKFVLSVW